MGVNNYQTILRIELNDQMCYSEHHLMVPEHFYYWVAGSFKPLLVFYFRVEEKFAGGKFREIPFAVDIYFAGGKFRAKIREYSDNFLHAKNTCYTVL